MKRKFLNIANHPEFGEEFGRDLLEIVFGKKFGKLKAIHQKSKDVKALSFRIRFYHAKIDAESLKSGKDYRNLKNIVAIMSIPFAPFGYNHMAYTIRNACQEVPELQNDDGARTIFLYTKGIKGNHAKELKDFLHYMEHSASENAKKDTRQKKLIYAENMISQGNKVENSVRF